MVQGLSPAWCGRQQRQRSRPTLSVHSFQQHQRISRLEWGKWGACKILIYRFGSDWIFAENPTKECTGSRPFGTWPQEKFWGSKLLLFWTKRGKQFGPTIPIYKVPLLGRGRGDESEHDDEQPDDCDDGGGGDDEDNDLQSRSTRYPLWAGDDAVRASMIGQRGASWSYSSRASVMLCAWTAWLSWWWWWSW